MKMLFALSLALTSLISFDAVADAPKMLSVKQSIEINANPDDVWAKARDYGDAGAWHPAVKKTEILGGENNKVGAIRMLTLQDGGQIREKLLAYDMKKRSFRYEILDGVMPVRKYVATISVAKTKDGKSVVTWQSSFKRKDESATPAPGQGDEDVTKLITGIYKMGLDNLKKISEPS